MYDPRDIIDAIERLGVHDPVVAQRLLDATRLYTLRGLRGQRLGYEKCERLAAMAAAAGCAEDYARRWQACEWLIEEAQNHGPEAAQALRTPWRRDGDAA